MGYSGFGLIREFAHPGGHFHAEANTTMRSCCIDKSSTAELSEAINSMFRWYRNAAICYAYLEDVTSLSHLDQSRWFTRGWTLQELVAPRDVLFYSSDWRLLGSKLELSDQLWKITRIEPEILSTGVFDHVSIATRMSWAGNRQTTRIEDAAYCLMGIFEVNMPLLYGEGRKSFTRLQEEIMKVSDDQSLFAWGLPTNIRTIDDFLASEDSHNGLPLHSLFADSPADFTLSDQIKVLEGLQPGIPPIIPSSGVRIELPVWTRGSFKFAAISCTVQGRYTSYLCIPLFSWSPRCTARYGDLVLVSAGEWSSSPTNIKAHTASLLIKRPISAPIEPPSHTFKIARVPSSADDFVLEEVYCLPHAKYSTEDGTVTLSERREGPHAVLFFTEKIKNPEVSERNPTSTTPPSQTRFALILGGDTTSCESAWTSYIDILGENSADEDFHRLLHRKGELVKYCMTRNQIISSLADNEAEKSFLQHREMHIRRTIKDWKESYDAPLRKTKVGPYFYREGIVPVRRSKHREVFIEVDLQNFPHNLVESVIFVFIQIFEEGNGHYRRTYGKPSWWKYPS